MPREFSNSTVTKISSDGKRSSLLVSCNYLKSQLVQSSNQIFFNEKATRRFNGTAPEIVIVSWKTLSSSASKTTIFLRHTWHGSNVSN
ncbi:uncharacterized protein Bfra_005175 [Botrytis fragariae]|uniref:Uncharacterized protein n=1 Tax=Botrytis fragariae TaxID=1964551 RepID=A0A8H6AU98_9HELO|nr:uncharacterized protein Bfra_005175 [Botrytis fragariae]KAF5873711.1 hypothetical protein Bfra_005175 [Botrytis fragariae]